MADKPYREAVGDLLWIARVYRYDLQYAVNACSRMSNNPGPKHWIAVCKILRYLNHTRDFKLAYHKSNPNAPVIGYTDSDFAPNYGNFFDNYRFLQPKQNIMPPQTLAKISSLLTAS
jgi:hypothetical protein